MEYFYIHGFASGENSRSFHELKKLLNGNVTCLTYDSSKSYSENIKSLYNQYESKCEDTTESMIIGCSLGGYYAYRFPDVNGHKCVLFNPVVNPQIQMRNKIGECTNYATGKKFTFTKEVLDSYPNFRLAQTPSIVYVSKKDEVLKDNWKLVQENFKHSHVIITETKHRIEDYSPYISSIKELANQIFFF